MEAGATLHKIRNFTQHPKNEKEYPFPQDYIQDYDVAIAELQPAITFGEFAKPIHLASASDKYRDGEGLVVTGWGYFGKEHNDALANNLQVLQLKFIANRNCTSLGIPGFCGHFFNDTLIFVVFLFLLTLC